MTTNEQLDGVAGFANNHKVFEKFFDDSFPRNEKATDSTVAW
jgi:hypothetical protein